MRTLAIIPARGGSKRIPRKNLKRFLGKPILAYSIEAAIKSNLFDEVMVSTDDAEIARLSRYLGANIPFMRSEQTANDHATTVEVLLEVIEKYKLSGISFDNICCLYPTAPFVSAYHLNTAFHKMVEEGFDSVFPIVPFSYPIQRALHISEGKVRMMQPQNIATRSQDLEKAYHDSGQFYWVKVKALLKEKTIITKNTGAIILNEMEAQDIDEENDWRVAEMKYRLLYDSVTAF